LTVTTLEAACRMTLYFYVYFINLVIVQFKEIGGTLDMLRHLYNKKLINHAICIASLFLITVTIQGRGPSPQASN